MKPINFDVRVKLIVLIIINFTATILAAPQKEILLITAIAVYYILQGRFLFAIKGLGIYLALFGAVIVFSRIQFVFVGMIVFTVIVVKRIFPIVFFAAGILSGSRFGQILYALQSFGLPKRFILMLSVGFRFFPSFSKELINNRNALKLRAYRSSGIIGRLYDLIIFSIVPLMRRSELVADELSQVAILRGIECPVKRTSMFAAPLRAADILFLICFVFIAAFSMVM